MDSPPPNKTGWRLYWQWIQSAIILYDSIRPILIMYAFFTFVPDLCDLFLTHQPSFASRYNGWENRLYYEGTMIRFPLTCGFVDVDGYEFHLFLQGVPLCVLQDDRNNNNVNNYNSSTSSMFTCPFPATTSLFSASSFTLSSETTYTTINNTPYQCCSVHYARSMLILLMIAVIITGIFVTVSPIFTAAAAFGTNDERSMYQSTAWAHFQLTPFFLLHFFFYPRDVSIFLNHPTLILFRKARFQPSRDLSNLEKYMILVLIDIPIAIVSTFQLASDTKPAFHSVVLSVFTIIKLIAYVLRHYIMSSYATVQYDRYLNHLESTFNYRALSREALKFMKDQDIKLPDNITIPPPSPPSQSYRIDFSTIKRFLWGLLLLSKPTRLFFILYAIFFSYQSFCGSLQPYNDRILSRPFSNDCSFFGDQIHYKDSVSRNTHSSFDKDHGIPKNTLCATDDRRLDTMNIKCPYGEPIYSSSTDPDIGTRYHACCSMNPLYQASDCIVAALCLVSVHALWCLYSYVTANFLVVDELRYFRESTSLWLYFIYRPIRIWQFILHPDYPLHYPYTKFLADKLPKPRPLSWFRIIYLITIDALMIAAFILFSYIPGPRKGGFVFFAMLSIASLLITLSECIRSDKQVSCDYFSSIATSTDRAIEDARKMVVIEEEFKKMAEEEQSPNVDVPMHQINDKTIRKTNDNNSNDNNNNTNNLNADINDTNINIAISNDINNNTISGYNTADKPIG